jgi:predicted dehydrogenase
MTHPASQPVGIGMIGAGNVLGRYLAGMSRFPQLAVRGCAMEVVVNITPPVAHAETTAAALAAGKHVYVEKPITTSLPEAQRLVALAGTAGLLLGGAPQRAGAALACHVIDVIEAMKTSSESGTRVTTTTRAERPDGTRTPQEGP